jgi:RNA polymerase sigma factor (sigma-70 family)
LDDDDRDLAARCASGDGGAWSELVARHDRRIALVLLRTVGRQGEADLPDLRQEVYARLLARDGAALRTLRAERPGALSSFLAQVALRVALDHARARRARPLATVAEDEVLELPAPAGSPEEQASDREARARLSEALQSVCDGANASRDLMVLRAHFDDGLSPAAIARMGCGLSPKGVETLLRRARTRIEARFAEAPPRPLAG